METFTLLINHQCHHR